MPEASCIFGFLQVCTTKELTDHTIAFERQHSFDMDKVNKGAVAYLNRYFLDRKSSSHLPLQSILNDMHSAKGNLSIYEVSKRNFTTIRQLERSFKIHMGLTPKEYAKIIRFQSALSIINDTGRDKSLSDIAFECGFYDHAHLTHEIKRHTGLTPSQF